MSTNFPLIFFCVKKRINYKIVDSLLSLTHTIHMTKIAWVVFQYCKIQVPVYSSNIEILFLRLFADWLYGVSLYVLRALVNFVGNSFSKIKWSYWWLTEAIQKSDMKNRLWYAVVYFMERQKHANRNLLWSCIILLIR